MIMIMTKHEDTLIAMPKPLVYTCIHTYTYIYIHLLVDLCLVKCLLVI